MNKKILFTAAILTVLVLAGTTAGAQGKAGNGDTAYTMWLVIFNDPSACAGGPGFCNLVDLGGLATTGVAYLGGTRVQSNGRMALAGSYGEGATVGLLGCCGGNGLIDADLAEIHIILQTHGRVQPDPDDFVTQITSVFGACNTVCADTFFAVFPAGAVSLTVDLQRISDESAVPGAQADITRLADGVIVSVIGDIN